MSMVHWWNDSGREPEKNLPQCHFILPKSHMDDPGLQLGVHSEKAAITLCELQHSQDHNLNVHVNFIHIMLIWKELSDKKLHA
jgi:hypothetical protein